MGQHVELAPDARYALSMATVEAHRLHHEYVGTEHLLLGLLQERSNEAVVALNQLGVAPQSVRQEIDATVKIGIERAVPVDPAGQLPFTTKGMKAINEAAREASRLEHRAVTAGDLLVGLLLEGRGIAAQLLNAAGAQVETVRAALHDTRLTT